MKFTELKKKLADGNANCIYLIEGDDAFFRSRAVEELKEKFVAEPQLDFASFEGDAILSAPDALISAIGAYPFMSEKRMVLVKEFYPKADFITKYLSAIFENPAPESLLAIENSKSSDALKKQRNVVLVDCDKEDVGVLVRWIVAEAGKEGVKIGSFDAEKVAEYCLRDMTRISVETAKLIAFAKPKGVITDADVSLLVTKETEYQIYEMTDYIARRRFDEAFSVIRDMSAKGESPQRLIVSIYNYFRRMLHIALSNADDKNLAQMLGIKEYAVKKTREQAKTFKKKALKEAVDFLCECDYGSKTGVTSFEDALANALFEILV